LDARQAAERLARHGPNDIPTGRGNGVLRLLWRQINSPLIWVLLGAALLAVLVDRSEGAKNGLVILAVVVANTLIGFIQEYRAGRAIAALARMTPDHATVIRDGARERIPARQLVPGDIIQLEPGDRAPADARILSERGLEMDESALTGESTPVEKSVAPAPEDADVADRHSMVFKGTLCTRGNAAAVVVETGERTQLGRIGRLLGQAAELDTPLTRSLASIGRVISVGVLIVACVMLVIGMIRTAGATGESPWSAAADMTIFAIALAVGAIPEGLPAIVTIIMAVGVRRMAARHAIVRSLPAVETLGSTTVICSDKTGTLTRNEMTVQELWTPAGGTILITGVGYAPHGSLQRHGRDLDAPDEYTRRLLHAGILCNDSRILFEDGRWTVHGDPTEGALLVAAAKASLDPDRIRRQAPRLDTIPFESERRYMATLHDENGGTVYLKGAPETVLALCTGSVDPAEAHRQVERMARQGLRVLAFASGRLDGAARFTEDNIRGGMTFLGLQGMIDPPRPEAIEAIRRCHQAGIVVKMITGDHAATAEAVGRQLLLAGPDAHAITGHQIEHMTDERLRHAAAGGNVFARVAPEHKLRLVRALQAQGHVVAMTGDGVNDAPALKQADIGVAMGITGTSVCKEAADIVLADDNFASIAAAVEEGRHVHDNLVKSLAFLLPTNLGLALVLTAAVLFLPFHLVEGNLELLLPMRPTQLLWINLVTAVALALPLAFEAREPGVMQRPPRAPDAPVLSAFVIYRTILAASLMTLGCVGLFLWEYRGSLDQGDAAALARAQTMTVTTCAMFQAFYLLNCRSLRSSILAVGLWTNPAVYVGIAALVVFQGLFIYAPFMHDLFGSAPLRARDVVLSMLAGVVILPVIGAEKWLRRRLGPPSSPPSARPYFHQPC
jgi:Ca2+-transporting ATPase